MTIIAAEKVPLNVKLTGNVWMITLPERWMTLDSEESSDGNSLFYFSGEKHWICVAIPNSSPTSKLFFEMEKDQVVFTEYEHMKC